jgi:dTDP-4-dehydrorhamnose reductase
MSKRILITGSNGLLGQKLISALKSSNIVLATSRGENIINDKGGYQYQSLDITSENDIKSTILKFKPDAVINTAAMTNVDTCENERENCDKINVHAVQYLADACTLIGAHLVHISTDFIFDGEGGPYSEDDVANPISYYGLSKWKSEKLLHTSGCNWSILRTIIIYGTADNLKRNNIVLWGRGALIKGEPLNIINDQFRSPTLAEDLAQACILVVNKKAIGTFHVSGKDIMSIYEMVERMAKFYKCDTSKINSISTSTLNQKAQRPLKTGFLLNKAFSKLGYQPHSFEEGLSILEKQLLN